MGNPCKLYRTYPNCNLKNNCHQYFRTGESNNFLSNTMKFTSKPFERMFTINSITDTSNLTLQLPKVTNT